MIARPTIKVGSKGSQVALVQHVLDVRPVDGDFGPMTEDAVKVFQRGADLDADGVAGPMTWEALELEFHLPPYPPPLPEPLDQKMVAQIIGMARSSDIARYEWDDRGFAPPSYIAGMAVAFATCVHKLFAYDPSVIDMASANSHDADKDALAWYADVFDNLGMSNERPGLVTLRHLFVLLLGLGMRESSGKYCEGRDQSAENTDSNTCEAGLFQQSWNSKSCSTDIERLFAQYSSGLGPLPPVQCALPIFSYEISCSESSWQCYGSGDGRGFQHLAKHCPQFAVEVAAIGLRHLRQHWGPINRQEVEVRPEADEMFSDVEAIVTAGIV
jgi:hypothetical protein